jgi:hypothetical protein
LLILPSLHLPPFQVWRLFFRLDLNERPGWKCPRSAFCVGDPIKKLADLQVVDVALSLKLSDISPYHLDKEIKSNPHNEAEGERQGKDEPGH